MLNGLIAVCLQGDLAAFKITIRFSSISRDLNADEYFNLCAHQLAFYRT